MKCPVCNAELIEDHPEFIENDICEAGNYCSHDCYSYDFAYGNYRERIGETEWVWTYKETNEEWQKRREERGDVIQQLKFKLIR